MSMLYATGVELQTQFYQKRTVSFFSDVSRQVPILIYLHSLLKVKTLQNSFVYVFCTYCIISSRQSLQACIGYDLLVIVIVVAIKGSAVTGVFTCAW